MANDHRRASTELPLQAAGTERAREQEGGGLGVEAAFGQHDQRLALAVDAPGFARG